jgi:hypothetical protein
MSVAPVEDSRPLNARIWPRSEAEWYVEPSWCSERLFAVEEFSGTIYDPACGMGRIPLAAMRAGLRALGSDMVNRGWDSTPQNFFLHRTRHPNIVTNPPFDIAPEFAQHALQIATRKVAIIFPTARLNAAHHWLSSAPLVRIWLLTPRPSMPPGDYILAGKKPGGGKMDFCWLVFEHGYDGEPKARWLHRDGDAAHG